VNAHGVVTRPSSCPHGVQGVAGSNPAVPTRPPPIGGGLVVTARLAPPLAPLAALPLKSRRPEHGPQIRLQSTAVIAAPLRLSREESRYAG